MENVPQIPVGTLCQVTLDALIQLFRRQTGFQVDLQPVVLRAALSHESACAEYQRTGYAEVGEQHFAQIFKDAFFAPVQPQGHVPQESPMASRHQFSLVTNGISEGIGGTMV